MPNNPYTGQSISIDHTWEAYQKYLRLTLPCMALCVEKRHRRPNANHEPFHQQWRCEEDVEYLFPTLSETMQAQDT